MRLSLVCLFSLIFGCKTGIAYPRGAQFGAPTLRLSFEPQMLDYPEKTWHGHYSLFLCVSLVFGGKTGVSYPHGVNRRASASKKKHARDKHSSLFCSNIGSREKRSVTLTQKHHVEKQVHSFLSAENVNMKHFWLQRVKIVSRAFQWRPL